MSYLHIENLYKEQGILMFKECYAMEKIHGTSAWLSYSPGDHVEKHLDGGAILHSVSPTRLTFFAGGGNYNDFVKLFDEQAIKDKLDGMGFNLKDVPARKHVHIYGEYYGGKIMGMGKTYGDKGKFVAFEVKIGDKWLNVEKAEAFVKSLGLEFVHYKRIPTTMEAIEAETHEPSVQAIRNGMGQSADKFGFIPPIREGIVLRPIEEVTTNNGERVIAKHKRPEFSETRTTRIVSPEKLKIIEEAKAIANEWVTRERLYHILDGIEMKVENTGKVIALMTEDILREAKGEIVDSPNARKQIAKETALLFKEMIKGELLK